MQGHINISFVAQRNALLNMPLYVGKPDIYSQIKYDEIVEYAAKSAGIAVSDMLSTMEALVDAFTYFLCNGHSFKLDGVGTFSLALSAATADPTNPNAATGASAVRKVSVNYAADKSLKTMLQSVGISTSASNPNNLAEHTDTYFTSLKFGAYSYNMLSFDGSAASALKKGDAVILNGGNINTDIIVKFTGKDSEDNEVSTEVTLRPTSKKTQTSAMAKVTDDITIASVTSIEINGETYTIDGSSDSMYITINGVRITNGGTCRTGSVTIVQTGKDLQAGAATLDGSPLNASAATDTKITYAAVQLTKGTHEFKYLGKTITFVATEQATANISALTSNGVSISNGGTSTMRQGVKYTFVASGNVSVLKSPSDVQTSFESTVVVKTSTSTQFVFEITPTAAPNGTMKIGEVFTVNVLAASDDVNITSVGGASDGGSVTQAKASKEYSVVATGGDLSSVVAKYATASNPSALKSDTNCVFDSTGKKLTFNPPSTADYVIYLTVGNTTYFTLNVKVNTSSGDDGEDLFG